ncbi:Uncharacterized protein dnm_093340 [Desulfonema magnum]|uniref:Uncharacterized protein n=1 Tax=Desulfonema magnum TaxID=45655 RepID=A0A975BX02_9BACT|nr:Uncharacterized protein dnm_093340 [Desulfonema magnum]
MSSWQKNSLKTLRNIKKVREPSCLRVFVAKKIAAKTLGAYLKIKKYEEAT